MTPSTPATPTPYPRRTLATRATGEVLSAAHVSHMDPVSVYGMCALRQDVFVIEQGVTSERELDERDLEAGTVTLWWSRGPRVIATIRVLRDEGLMRIGRLATAQEARRGGFGGEAMRAAIEICRELEPTQPIEIHGQSYLKAWYESMGYVCVGEEFLEAGIWHYPMRYDHA